MKKLIKITTPRTFKEHFSPNKFYRVMFFNPSTKEANVYLLDKKLIDERNVFQYKDNAYVISKDAITLIDKIPYLIYVEDNPLPIHFNGSHPQIEPKLLAKLLKTDLWTKFLFTNPHIDFVKLMIFGVLVFAGIIIAIKVMGG